MITILLTILFSKILSFTNLSVPILLSWYSAHPFITIMAVYNIISDCLTISGFTIMISSELTERKLKNLSMNN